MKLNKLNSYNEKTKIRDLTCFIAPQWIFFLPFVKQLVKSCSPLAFSNMQLYCACYNHAIYRTWIYHFPSWLKVYSSHCNIFASSDFRFKTFLVIISLCLESRWPNQEFLNKCVIVCSFAVGLLFFKASRDFSPLYHCCPCILTKGCLCYFSDWLKEAREGSREGSNCNNANVLLTHISCTVCY